METNMKMEYGDGDDDDWLVSSILEKKDEDDDEDDFDILDSEGEVVEKSKFPESATAAAAPSQEEEEYADMDGFEDDNVLMDGDAAVVKSDGNDQLLKVRTYDISITYDKVRS
jgi:hypothetical protein